MEDRVLLMHKVSDQEAETLLEKAAVFAMPSTAEGLGLSLQEAQWHSCACIGSRIGGIPELIEDGRTGILVPPADPRLLAQGLSRLMQDPALRKRFSEAGKRSILSRGMTSEAMVQRYLAMYGSHLGRG